MGIATFRPLWAVPDDMSAGAVPVLVPEQALAATYSPAGYASAWDAVEAYRRWQDWQVRHPEAGRTRAARALEMPASRVRGWQDGGMPDPVRGLREARKRDWVNVEPGSGRAVELVRVLAWTVANGSLPQGNHASGQWTPRWSVRDEQERAWLLRDLEAIGVDVRFDHRDRQRSGEEAVPQDAGNLLGRVLVTLGAEGGPRREVYERVPAVVRRDGDGRLATAFVRTYLRARGAVYDERPRLYQLQEARQESYLRSLAGVIEAVLGVDVSVGVSTLRFDARAALALQEG